VVLEDKITALGMPPFGLTSLFHPTHGLRGCYETKISCFETTRYCALSVAKTPYITKILSFVTASHTDGLQECRAWGALGTQTLTQRLPPPVLISRAFGIPCVSAVWKFLLQLVEPCEFRFELLED